MMEPYVSAQSLAGVTVVKVHGPLKLGHPALDELRRRCSELCSRNEIRVVIDLEAVPAVDSSGIGALLHGLTTMRNRGGECKLLNPSKLTREVLELVGLLKVFSVYQDREQAVASFHHAA